MPTFRDSPGAPPAGETAALRGVVRAVAAAVLRLKPDHPDVEDCASETVRRAIEGEGRLRAGDPRRPWVIGIARHVALDMLRAKKRTRLGDDLGGDESSSWAERVPDSSPGPDELLERAQGREQVQPAIPPRPQTMHAPLPKLYVYSPR